jgi:cyclic peptide transporter
MAGRHANRLWESTRDMQNVFFRYITDVIGGFKELALSNVKSEEFKSDMENVCCDYRDKRGKAAIGFANVFIIGELLFTSAIGVVAFLFPVVFKQLQADSLRSYILVLLYMTGPVNGLLNIIPNAVQIRISWRRVKVLIKELSDLGDNHVEARKDNKVQSKVTLQLKNVQYEYSNESGESFEVGPINYTFNSEEIIFITGGNGSGKSTLAKLITGLYVPKNGEILVNGEKISCRELGENYSTVFGDFYLFEKMYGIDYESKEAEINKYLDILQIKDKVQITNGAFSTTKLSTGQRKRMALMISYLEDRPIYLFDEWAADQDPEFRRFFYMVYFRN